MKNRYTCKIARSFLLAFFLLVSARAEEGEYVPMVTNVAGVVRTPDGDGQITNGEGGNDRSKEPRYVSRVFGVR